MFEYFTEKSVAVILAAQEEARQQGHNFVGTEQVLLGLLRVEDTFAQMILLNAGITLEAARRQIEAIVGRGSGFVPADIPFTPKTKKVFEQSLNQARQLNSPYVAPEHLLLGLIQEGESVALKVMENLGLDPVEMQRQLLRAADEIKNLEPVGVQGRATMGRSTTKTKVLDEIGTNLTQMAVDGKLDPMIGRQPELERMIQILGRRTKNNPVLLGEPGVGKTAIAEGLAQRIVDRVAPELLLDKQIISLDMGSLLAGTRFRGDFEERLTQIVAEVKQAQNIILVIDEIHTLVGAGGMEGGTDAANILKPALARGEFQVIGATTLDEYRKHIERDAALERRFQPIMVGEPTVEETIDILWGLRDRYEQHHRVTMTNEALEAAAVLSDRYIADRFLPDKAIDLIDEAGSLVRLRHTRQSPAKALRRELQMVTAEKELAVKTQDFDKAGQLRDQEMALEAQLQELQATAVQSIEGAIVSVKEIAQVVADWTSIPVMKLTESESALLLHLEDTLHQRVIGQHEAVTAVARAIRRARVGLRNPERPIASLIFSGPTGVGKTELAKALATSVFGAEDAMIRLDMSEYMESHTVAKLIGSPPGYVGYDEGGQLTEAVRRKPYTVLLLDEIEKAHPDIFNTLLQLLEDGRLTDAKGRTVSFKNTLIIMTSNIGSRSIEKGGSGLGFEFAAQADGSYQRMRDRVNEDLKQYFRPELLNRIDEIIVFRQLQRDEVRQIADLQVREVANRLSEQGIRLEVTDALKAKVVTEGYDPRYGARPLRRAIARLLEDYLAEAMLVGEVRSGDTAIVDVDDDEQVQVRRQAMPVLAGVTQ